MMDWQAMQLVVGLCFFLELQSLQYGVEVNVQVACAGFFLGIKRVCSSSQEFLDPICGNCASVELCISMAV